MTRWPPNMTIRPLTRPGMHTSRNRSKFRAPWSQTLDLLDRADMGGRPEDFHEVQAAARQLGLVSA